MEGLARLPCIGLTETMHATRCVVLYQIGGRDAMPKECTRCPGKRAQLPDILQQHRDHGVPPHDVGALNARMIDNVDSLTVVDRQLYTAAVGRFVTTARLIEARTNSQFTCRIEAIKLCTAPAYAYLGVALEELCAAFVHGPNATLK